MENRKQHLNPPSCGFTKKSAISVRHCFVCALSSVPGHKKEDATDSQVGQKHEEPDSWGKGIQEREVAWPPSLKKTHRMETLNATWPGPL